MVKITEIPIKMDDLGGKTHHFRKHPQKKTLKMLPVGRALLNKKSFFRIFFRPGEDARDF